jgi:hypothetical protein
MLKSSSLCLYSSNFGTFWLKIEQFWPLNILRDFLWTLNFYRFWPIMKFKKRGDEIKKKLLLWNYWANFNQTLLRWSLGGPFEEISIFSKGGHLGYRKALTDTILKGDHLRIISAKFGWNWLSSFRGEVFFNIFSSETTEPISTKLCWNDP